MIGRERASVEEGTVEGGRVAEGNERGRDGGRKRAEEGLSEEGREQGSKEAREEGKLQRRYPDEGTGQVHTREPGRSRVTI